MAAATGNESPRKVLITGISKGLGRALALELANRGHTIIGCSRDETKLDSLQAQLCNISLNPHFLFKVDVVCNMYVSCCYVVSHIITNFHNNNFCFLQRSNKNVQEFAQIVAKNQLVPDILGIFISLWSIFYMFTN